MNLEDLSGEVVKSQVRYENEARLTKAAEIRVHNLGRQGYDLLLAL